jgi:hypothetical protein
MVFCSQCGCRISMLFCRSSTGKVLCFSEDLRSRASLVSKVSITVVVQSRLLILGIHATACRLFSASILLVPPLFFAHSQSHSRFIAIVLCAILSPCCYRYLPRSTEPIPSGPLSCCSTDHVNLSLSLQSLRRCRRHLSLLSYPLALVLSLSLSLSSATSTSQITASKPHRSSAPREGVLS